MGRVDDDFNAKQNGLAGVRLPDFGRLGKALGRQIEEEPEPETDEQGQFYQSHSGWF